MYKNCNVLCIILWAHVCACVCLPKLCGKLTKKEKCNMAKFSRGLPIDFVKQPRTRKSLTNPPLWCQLHKMSLSSAIIEHWADYCCPGVIPSFCPEPFDFESVLSFYAVSDIWAWSRCCCVKHRSVGTSLFLLHKKVPLPLEMWRPLMPFVCESVSLMAEMLKQICPSKLKDSWKLSGWVWVSISQSGEEFMSPVDYRTIDWLSR